MNTTISSLFSLKNRTAIVTGGPSGIGYMSARGLLLAGAQVYIVGRDESSCHAKAQELCEFGDCRYFVADLTAPNGIELLVKQIKEKAPNVSILHNNAGITGHSPLGEYSEELFESVINVNLKAPFMLTQALLPLLKANASQDQPAQVINTGSVAAILHTSPDSWAYGPSKSGLHHLTKMLAKKLSVEHVHFNVIAPGLFPSQMSAWIVEDDAATKASLELIPAGRLGEPNDIASLIVFIASSRYLTGAVITIDGGYSL